MININNKFEVNKPHKKNYLTTPFGRLLEAISYSRLGLITLSIWALSTAYFAGATYCGHGMSINAANLSPMDSILSAMYFSAVTITTLGYGDIVPLGAGRIVAVFLALNGLTLIAIVIGKISSERQSSLLLLLHTSDVERRISSFAEQIHYYINEINISAANTDIDELHKKLKELKFIVESINKFMVFHIYQSLFIEIGTNSSVKKLMVKFSECHDVIFGLANIAKNNQKIESAAYSISKKFRSIEDMLATNSELKQRSPEVFSCKDLRAKHERFTRWKKTTMTESLLGAVQLKLPNSSRQEWPKHIHKNIAQDLDISNNLIIECIDELKNRNLC